MIVVIALTTPVSEDGKHTVGTVLLASLYNTANAKANLNERLFRKSIAEKMNGSVFLKVDILTYTALVNLVTENSTSIQVLEMIAQATISEEKFNEGTKADKEDALLPTAPSDS